MKEIQYDLMLYLAKGVTPLKQTPTSTPCLLSCEGVFPEDGTLVSKVDLNLKDLSSLAGSYPYPQLFVLSTTTLAFTADGIYEWVAGSWNLAFSELTAGAPWTLADFGPFIMMTNGVNIVIKDSSGYRKLFDPLLPTGLVLAGQRQQVVFGAPDFAVADSWDFTVDAYTSKWLHLIINEDLPGTHTWA